MARLADNLRGARLGSSAGTLAVGTSLANAFGYVLTVVAARRLGPEEFGAFSALLALIIVGNVAALAAQATTARDVAVGRGAAAAARSGLGLAAIVGLLLSASSPLLRSVLNLPSTTSAVAAGVAVAALAATAPALGLAQGRERFRVLAALVSAQAALRVGGGLVGIAVEPSATAALTGVAAGFVAAGVLAWAVSPPPLSSDAGFAVRAMAASGAMLLSFVVLTNIDVMLARHVLSAEASGLYAAGSIFTKVTFWLPQFVPLLAFPALSDPGRRRRAVAGGAIAVTALGAAIIVGSWLLASPAVRLVTGSAYVDLVPWVAGFTCLGALYALAHLLVYARLARGDRWTTVVLWAVLISYVTVVEATADDLAGVLMPGIAAAATIVLWGLIRERPHVRRTHYRRPVASP